MKRTEIQRRVGLSPGSGPKRTRKPARSEHEVALALAFHDVAMAQGGCAWCGSDRDLEAHHAIPKSFIKRELATCRPEDVWCPENAVALCRSCHAVHTHGLHRAPRSVLPGLVWQFAARLDGRAGTEAFTCRLERDYPDTEARAA